MSEILFLLFYTLLFSTVVSTYCMIFKLGKYYLTTIVFRIETSPVRIKTVHMMYFVRCDLFKTKYLLNSVTETCLKDNLIYALIVKTHIPICLLKDQHLYDKQTRTYRLTAKTLNRFKDLTHDD